MPEISARPEIEALKPYVPGLSIAEIQQRYGLSQVIKMASNENPLGASPLAQEAIRRHAASAFRYPQGGNPRLVTALADFHRVDARRLVVGNGSDEIIDLLIRILAVPVVTPWSVSSPASAFIPFRAGSQASKCAAARWREIFPSISRPCFVWWMKARVWSL